jgi:uncharacterized membrane protein YccC
MQLKHAIKSGLAAALAAAFCQLLGWPRIPWAAVTAVVVMQSNLGGAFYASWQRLLGTAMGGLAGALTATALASASGLPWLTPPAVALGVTAVILVCSRLGWTDAYRVAGLTVILVVLSTSDDSPWLVGVERFRDVAVGILAALAVTVTVWPAQARHNFKVGLGRVLTLCAVGYRSVAERIELGPAAKPVDPHWHEQVRSELAALEQLLKDMKSEPRSRNLESGVLVALLTAVERIHEETTALERMGRDPLVEKVAGELSAPLAALTGQTLEAFHRLAEDLAARLKPVDLPDLTAAAAELERQFMAGHATLSLTGPTIPQWFAVFYCFRGLRAIARELEGVSARLRHLA